MSDSTPLDSPAAPLPDPPARQRREQRWYPLPPADPMDRSTHGFRQLLGALGVVLPLLCWIWAIVLPSTQDPTPFLERLWPLHALSSVSAYYYTSAVGAFVGILVAMGLFLFTYRGFEDKRQAWDYWVSSFAGAMAIGVALCPTATPKGFEKIAWWHPLMGKIHLTAAALLFTTFIVFCWALFPTRDKRVTEHDRIRLGYQKYGFLDRLKHYPVYYGCGLGILGCLAWAVLASRAGRSMFVAEWLALWFFGVSWLRKGQVLWSMHQLARRLYRGQPAA